MRRGLLTTLSRHKADMTKIPRNPARWNGDHDERGIPIVDARRTRNGRQLEIVCPFCGEKHLHGAVSPQVGAGNGHRLAHCLKRTEQNDKGYILVEVGSTTEANVW